MFILLGAVANDLAPRQRRSLSVLRSRFLASVGRYSYGMYVFHMFFAIFAPPGSSALPTHSATHA
jgi:peptidoglycan/LPS O-acetylase OafA/YrhL